MEAAPEPATDMTSTPSLTTSLDVPGSSVKGEPPGFETRSVRSMVDPARVAAGLVERATN